MRKFSILLLILSVLGSNKAFSQLYNGQTQSETNLNELIEKVNPGTILLLGENHGLAAHRDQHMQVLNALRQKGLKVSVGLEFVNYTDQNFVNQYREGNLPEDQFLADIKWGGISFDFYKQQLNFPLLGRGESSLGLNLPRTVTSKLSKGGLAALAPEDTALMPPNFALGRDSYKARFMEAAGAHCPSPDNCFIAQCAWDDTMAWQAVNFISTHPDQVLVVVVGEFHVQFGGGIKYRIQQRLPGAEVATLSQVWADGMTDDEVRQALQPSPVEGPRADFIWVSKP
ncbi:MAG: ChaN family lipoprotein [Pseudobdellovibrio sp.]